MAIRQAGKIAAAAFAAFSATAAAQETAAPAFRLGDAATPTRYEWHVSIDPRATTFEGDVRIDVKVNRATPLLWLNATRLTIERARATQGDREIELETVAGGEEAVGLRAKGEPFAEGNARIAIRYRGPLEPLATRGLFRQQEGGESYVISQFEAVNARRAVPCFDEPGWKTPWTITIDAPDGNVAVSNAPTASASPALERRGWRRHVFAPTRPLPTYLVALAVGPFDTVDGGTAGLRKTPLRYFTPKGRGREARYAAEATPRLLELLEDYFGSAYPFEKLDSLVIPQAVNFGAMENAGLITYDASLLLATPARESDAFQRRYASIAAHELAHMWFGDSVTLAWWDDIWLNEGFASWMGAKTLRRFNPAWDTPARRAQLRMRAIEVDRLGSARAIRAPVGVKEDLAGAFSSITYDKAAVVLEMFETAQGPERFREGVREYLKQYAYGSATSADFYRVVSGPGLESFVDRAGVPLVDAALRCERGDAALELSQARLQPRGTSGEGRTWNTPVCFRDPAEARCDEISVDPRRRTLPSCPTWIVGNAAGTGYYVVRYEEELRKRVLRRFASLPAAEAAVFVSDAGLLARSGLSPMEAAVEAAEAGLLHSSSSVRLAAVRVLEKIPEVRGKQEVVARRIQPLARTMGWSEKPGESYEARELRVRLLPFAARQRGGEPLRAEASTLARAWQRNREAIAATMVQPVLDTAARFADRATYELLESLMLTAGDAVERRELQWALAKARAPVLRARALELSLRKVAGADAIRPREMLAFVREALEDDANRIPAFDYLQRNYDALGAKMPPDTAARFMSALRDLCTPAERDAFVAFFKDRAPKLQGGARRYAEALEAIDVCVATASRAAAAGARDRAAS